MLVKKSKICWSTSWTRSAPTIDHLFLGPYYYYSIKFAIQNTPPEKTQRANRYSSGNRCWTFHDRSSCSHSSEHNITKALKSLSFTTRKGESFYSHCGRTKTLTNLPQKDHISYRLQNRWLTHSFTEATEWTSSFVQ